VNGFAPRLQAASLLLDENRWREAAALLRDLTAQHPSSADARRLYGVALRGRGDTLGAETQFRQALALDARSGPTAVALSEQLLSRGAFDEALSVVAELAGAADADIHILTAQGFALKALRRLDEALGAFERATLADPASGVAEHNLAALLGDIERFELSETATRRAFAKGLDAAETWLIHARALLGLGRHDEAEAAFRDVLRRRPDHVDAHAEMAQLIWMRTEDWPAAIRTLDAALAAFPNLQALALKKAEFLQYVGQHDAAIAAISEISNRPDAEPMIHVVAARLCSEMQPDLGLRHAWAAARALPEDRVALGALCEAYLAVGDTGEALRVASRLLATGPLDQHTFGLIATAWRLAGNPRYATLHDYGSLVRTSRIDTPQGWPNLEAFLASLASSLERLHGFKTHPIGQSVRHGSQTSYSLTLSDDPVIKAFFKAIDGPIRRYMAALGPGPDPVRSRNTGDYRFNGVWSVRLRPDGYHSNHLHPRGWLSSACYIALPRAVERDHEGWLKFGEPGVPTTPALAPEYFIKPEPGLLALFPSYMWHGTVPFGGAEPRLTIAFDVIPA
jgi:tetratricopeptide (TPR) repeat protein